MKIGELVKHKGKIYKAIGSERNNPCILCTFYKEGCLEAPRCWSSIGDDEDNIIWEEVIDVPKTEEETT